MVEEETDQRTRIGGRSRFGSGWFFDRPDSFAYRVASEKAFFEECAGGRGSFFLSVLLRTVPILFQSRRWFRSLGPSARTIVETKPRRSIESRECRSIDNREDANIEREHGSRDRPVNPRVYVSLVYVYARGYTRQRFHGGSMKVTRGRGMDREGEDRERRATGNDTISG